MSDLISRNEVNDVIDELEVYTCGRPNTMKVEVSVLQLQRFINKLKNIPTAYDVDKVVRELLALNKNYNDGINLYEEVAEIPTEEAIEIVKQGGVSNDVCKWRQTSTTKYKTGCGYKLEEFFDTNACFCKQCGKRIVINEGRPYYYVDED